MAFTVLGVLLVVILVAVILNRARRSPGDLPAQLRRGGFVAAALVLLLMAASCITIIRAGHVGVVDVFGRVSSTTLKSGIQFVNPFARVVQMSIQTQELKEVMDVPSKEGMTIGDLKKLVESRGIAIESTPMRKLTLPAKITSPSRTSSARTRTVSG
jgi:regulator of protease activity HflC (stomatin/prohibitin superfamily)